MARAAAIQAGFNNGEISPFMYGRVDVEKYPLSLRECTNMRVVVQGPATKRDGSRFVAPVADETQASRLFEFEFNPTQGYAIEINGNRARFFTNRGLLTEAAKAVTGITQANPAVVTTSVAHGYVTGDQVVFPVVGPYGALQNQVFTVGAYLPTTFQLSGYDGTGLPAFSGSPTVARVYSVPAPYSAADLPTVTDLHAADVLNLYHPKYQPQKLTRNGATNWAFVPFVFKDGPYLTEDPQGITLTPSDTGSLTPKMTSNTTAAPPSVTGWNIYVGTSPGAETLQNNAPIATGTPWVEPTTGLVAGAAPPGVNTAGLSPPTNGTLTQTAGGSLAATTYYVKTTWVTPTGETLPSAETSLSVSLNNVLNAAAPAAPSVAAGVASTSNSSSHDYQMFDRNKSQDITVAGGSTGFIRYDLGAGVQKVVDAYWLTTSQIATNSNDYFTDWQIQGSNDGVNWVTLDTRAGETGWNNAETRYYSFTNIVPYRFYQMSFSGGGGADATHTVAGELSFHVAAVSQTPITLAASGTASINGGAGFLATDVGRCIRVMGSDGRWRWASIISVLSTTQVTVTINGQALPDTSPITRWRLGLFSDTTGWPTCGAYYQDRLAVSGPPSYPNYVCFSTSGVYDTFTPSEDDGKVTEASGFAYQLLERQVTAINWFQPVYRGMIIGTAEGEAIVQPMVSSFTTPAPFSALNFKTVWPTEYGSAPLRPKQVDTATLFVDRRSKRVREMNYELQSDSFTAPNMNAMADHITQNGGIKRIAWMRHPDRTYWATRADGTLLGFSYEREQSVTAWHKHTLAGFNGANGVVEDCIVISSPDGMNEDLWLIVRRGTRRFVEYIGDWWWHDTAQADACFVDASVKYTGTPTATVAGLAHLEGQTVRVLADGVQANDVVVTNGQVTIERTASTITVGLPFKARLWTLRPNAGAQNGTAQGKMKKIYKYILRLYRSFGGQIGDSQNRLNDLPYWRIATSFMQAPGLFSGDIGPQAFPGGWELDGGTVFENDSAYPFTVIAYMPQIATEDA